MLFAFGPLLLFANDGAVGVALVGVGARGFNAILLETGCAGSSVSGIEVQAAAANADVTDQPGRVACDQFEWADIADDDRSGGNKGIRTNLVTTDDDSARTDRSPTTNQGLLQHVPTRNGGPW